MKGLELAHHKKDSTVQTVGKAQMQQWEDAKPVEADLGNLFRQKYPPWQTVGKEETTYSHAIPSCGNNTHGSGYLGLALYRSVSSRKTLWRPTPQRRSQEEGYPWGGDYKSLSSSVPISLPLSFTVK